MPDLKPNHTLRVVGDRLRDPIAPWRRLAQNVVALVWLLAFGIVGYILIEDWSFLDALYMTVTTVTTVGFREVQPLSQGGRIFTIFVVLFGVGVALYILTTLVQEVIEGELGQALGVRRMRGRIESLRDHCIICGFGRVGQEIANELAEHGVPFVIVENNAEAVARAGDYLLVDGDATQEMVLQKAGIQRARALMAASDSDAGNTYIVLTANALNPDLFVVARARQRASQSRMLQAGANRVISPYVLAGRRMALSALQPLTVDFIDVLASGQKGEQLLGEVVVLGESLIAEHSVEEAMSRCKNTTLLAIQRPDGELLAGPRGSSVLRPGDRLMLLSNQADMEELGRTAEASIQEGQTGRTA